MNALVPLVAVAATAVTTLLMDAVWLTLRNDYHKDLFMKIQGSPLTPRLLPAIGVYILIPVAIYLYAISVAKSVGDAAWKGALIGFVLYAFYDFTNYATLTDYTAAMTVTDILWGTVLCTVGAAVGFSVSRLVQYHRRSGVV